MNLYTTLENYSQTKSMGGRSQSLPVANLRAHERMLIIQDLEAASRRIDTWCGRHFYPLLDEYFFDHKDGKEIKFGLHDLVRADTVYTANRADTVAASEYYLLTGTSYNYAVKNRLKIKNESGAVLYVGTGYQQANSIIGVWTYHEQWPTAWLSSLDTVKTQLEVGVTTLAVNAVMGVNGAGYSPRFQVGQLLEIDDEWLYVADTDSQANTLTVARAQNGTPDAVHTVGTAITIYQPMADVAKACRIVTDFMRVVPQAHPTGKMQMPGAQTVDLSIPTAAQELLEPYRRVLIGRADDERARIDPMYLPPIGEKYS